MGAHFLFVTWAGGGNVNPVLALAPRLSSRGHHVRVFGEPALASQFARDGIDFVARTGSDMWDVGLMAREVLDECERVPTDVVVVDYMLPGALCGAEGSGRATVAFVHTLYAAMLYRGELVPMLMAADVAGVNRVRAELGLPEVTRLADLVDRAAIALVTSPRELDNAAARVPDNVHYVGPVLEDAGEDFGWEPPGTRADGPLVAVSLGTTPMDEAPAVQRVLDALAGVHARAVVAVGDHLDPAAFAAPVNVTMSRYVRHAVVLPHVALLVTHAGLGSVVAALAHGVPLLCLPLGREQPQNAAAAARIGAGLVLASDAAVDDVRAAIVGMLSNPDYQAAAERMAASIAAEGSGDRAITELEKLTKRNRL